MCLLMQAPYLDPRTKLRYANAGVFKVIRSLPNEYVQRYLALRNAAVVLRWIQYMEGTGDLSLSHTHTRQRNMKRSQDHPPDTKKAHSHSFYQLLLLAFVICPTNSSKLPVFPRLGFFFQKRIGLPGNRGLVHFNCHAKQRRFDSTKDILTKVSE